MHENSATASGTTLVRRLYGEILTEGQLELADDLVADEFIAHDGPGRQLNGPESIKATGRTLHAAFSDLRFDIEDLLADGDRVAARWSMSGTHTGEFMGLPPSGDPIQQQAIVIVRVQSGRIAELWAKLDSAITTSPSQDGQ